MSHPRLQVPTHPEQLEVAAEVVIALGRLVPIRSSLVGSHESNGGVGVGNTNRFVQDA